jgi:membrane fusion protein, multidrug efflux system
MKKLALIVGFVAVAGGLAWLIWLKPDSHEAEEARSATEVPVHIGKITRTTLRRYVTAYGTVEAEPAGERPAASARVAPSLPGVVTAVQCVEGQHVAAGTLLFQLDSRAADVAVAFAEKSVERQQQLMRVEGTSQKALQDAELQLASTRAPLALLQIRSPLSGTVVRVNVRPGEAVDLTTVLAEVIDLDRLVVSASVPSTDLAGLTPGQHVEVQATTAAAPGHGTVSYVSPLVDPKTGTALVRIALPSEAGLRPGEFVTVRIVSEEHPGCLAVPVESVVKDSDGVTVIALVEADHAVQKAVTAGVRDGNWVEVEADGLQPDMPVVTDGAYGLPKETKIRVLGK